MALTPDLPAFNTDASFATECWQQRPTLLKRNAHWQPPLDIDDIAGLALEPNTEARLIFRQSKDRYDLHSDVLDELTLTQLPGQDWTLLVQDVDKHVPEVRELLDAFPFVPDWLVDDIMVSIAAPGGSVGPHRDSYDVFLLQGDGIREWQTGTGHREVSAGGLRLLTDAVFDSGLDCQAGDVLYVPPGHAHFGVAKTLCSTWSIGLQAPSLSELTLLAGIDPDAVALDQRWRPALRDRLYPPGQIDAETLAALPINASPADKLQAVGRAVSRCKPELTPNAHASGDQAHPWTRLAYGIADHALWVFANGHAASFEVDRQPSIATLCAHRRWDTSSHCHDLRDWLARAGAFDNDFT
ncbi:MAG: cupin domain-containing protein [Pseudomonadota bacterium]